VNVFVCVNISLGENKKVLVFGMKHWTPAHAESEINQRDAIVSSQFSCRVCDEPTCIAVLRCVKVR